MYRTKNKHHAQEFDLYDDLAKIKEALSDTAIHMKDRATGAIGSSVESVRDNVKGRSADLENWVTEKPLKSLGFAMLSGIFLGYLMRGRRNSHRR